MRAPCRMMVICVAMALSGHAQAECGCYRINGTMQSVCQSTTDLPQACPSRECAAPLAPSPQANVPAQLSPTAQHAAYCVGALQALAPTPTLVPVEGNPFAPPDSPEGRAFKAWSLAHPSPALSPNENKRRQRLQRYSAYLQREILGFAIISTARLRCPPQSGGRELMRHE